jgi:hypothetical protein
MDRSHGPHGAAGQSALITGADVVMPCHRNRQDGKGGPIHWECWLKDPDGYTVVLASPDGTAGPGLRADGT